MCAACRRAISVLTASVHEKWLIVYLICPFFPVWAVPVVEMEATNTLLGEAEGIPIPSRRWLPGALERIGEMAVMVSEFTFPLRHQNARRGPVGGGAFTFLLFLRAVSVGLGMVKSGWDVVLHEKGVS